VFYLPEYEGNPDWNLYREYLIVIYKEGVFYESYAIEKGWGNEIWDHEMGEFEPINFAYFLGNYHQCIENVCERWGYDNVCKYIKEREMEGGN
jgi:hypothetical protein